MINDAHVLISSKDAQADRAFLRDVLGFRHVDAGGGCLLFALPPTETGGTEQLFLMCDDLDATMTDLAEKGVTVGAIETPRRGKVTTIDPPGGGRLGLYEPNHPRP